MKLPLAIFIYLLIGFVLGMGILMAVKGSFWLLIASALAYIIAFARIGCLHH
jgi:hypothetical protein